jgi:hypothetical protein
MSPTANSAFSTLDGRFVTRAPRRLEPTRLVVGDDWAAWREPVMQRLEDLVQLPQGDARPVRFEVAHFTMQMLKSICPPDTAPPQIAAGAAGDLQVEWNTPSTRIELHVMAPNSVSAWRQIPGLPNGEEARLTNDFLIVFRWVREMIESGTPNFGLVPSPIMPAATLPAETLSILDRLAYSVDQSVIDHEFLEKARAAKDQAVTLVRRNRLIGRPRVMMSDDGVLTLQWRNGSNGAALIFPGDGTVSFAVKNAQQTYSDSSLGDAPLDSPLPEEFRAALEALVA